MIKFIGISRLFILHFEKQKFGVQEANFLDSLKKSYLQTLFGHRNDLEEEESKRFKDKDF